MNPVSHASERIRTAYEILTRRKVTRIKDVICLCKTHLESHALEVLSEARKRLQSGHPPSMRNLCGISDLEVPMNKVLGWTFDPSQSGPLARSALLALADLIEFREFKKDVLVDSRIKVLCEQSPDLSITTRKPDLTIESPHSFLLIENKVKSQQSDEKQYSDYLEVVQKIAKGRIWRVHLLAPTVREVPEGWNRSISHKELASALRPLILDAQLVWDRVRIALLVEDLDPDPLPDRMGSLRKIVGTSETRPLVFREIRNLSNLLSRRYVPLIDDLGGSDVE